MLGYVTVWSAFVNNAHMQYPYLRYDEPLFVGKDSPFTITLSIRSRCQCLSLVFQTLVAYLLARLQFEQAKTAMDQSEYC